MNRFSSFLFVIFATSVGLSNAKLWAANGLHFRNSLGPGNILGIFCKWDGKQQSTIFLNPGETYVSKFHDDYVIKFTVDCDLWQPAHKVHALIRAFEGGSGVFDHGKQNYWDARRDGIYFTHGKEVPKLEYKWIH